MEVIYTDFAQAFDKCETNVLLHTLRDCGVKGKIGLWIAAPLTQPLECKLWVLMGHSQTWNKYYLESHKVQCWALYSSWSTFLVCAPTSLKAHQAHPLQMTPGSGEEFKIPQTALSYKGICKLSMAVLTTST